MHNKKTKEFSLSNLTEEQRNNVASEVLRKMEKEGMSLKDATGVTEELLEEIYALAHGYYNQGKYIEANSLFQFLIGTSPAEYKYALGLGATFHQMGVYQEATYGFYLAHTIDEESPIAPYYIIDCFLKQGRKEEAKELAQLTLELCGKREEFEEIKQRCELIAKS